MTKSQNTVSEETRKTITTFSLLNEKAMLAFLVFVQKVVNRLDNILEKRIISIEKRHPLSESERSKLNSKL